MAAEAAQFSAAVITVRQRRSPHPAETTGIASSHNPVRALPFSAPRLAMTKHTVSFDTEHLPGYVGLFLLLLIGRLADWGYGPQQTFAQRVSGWIARRAIDVLAIVGWLADRLPEPGASSRHPLPTHA
jgi:hypothetical protein